jgi:hypothetical protein
MATTKKKTSSPKTKTSKIAKRKDVKPKRGLHEYGDVTFADPENKKYPIDTEEHIRAAWSYIHHADNAAKYAKADVTKIKARIKRAAKKNGIEIQAK